MESLRILSDNRRGGYAASGARYRYTFMTLVSVCDV